MGESFLYSLYSFLSVTLMRVKRFLYNQSQKSESINYIKDRLISLNYLVR